LIATVLSSSGAWSQSRENQHQQNLAPSAQTHAVGRPTDSTKSFVENYAPPPDISSEGHRISWLFEYTSWVTFGFFVLMAGILIYFVAAYRSRPGHKATYTKGLTKPEKLTAKGLDLAVFLSLDLVLIWFSFKETNDYLWNFPEGPNVVQVQIMPQQWSWNFKLPGIDGKFGTEDDIVTMNELRIPRGQPIVAQMKAKDVIHGFLWIDARMQMDAIPGSVTKFWFDANKSGDYELTCAHMCGTYHYKMKGFIKVMEPDDYKAWVAEMSAWSKATVDHTDKSLVWGWNWGI
jgi:cytochrome c oxidase subunit 2